jgi:DNA polymerase
VSGARGDDGVGALAADFAAHFEHLEQFCGVRYVQTPERREGAGDSEPHARQVQAPTGPAPERAAGAPASMKEQLVRRESGGQSQRQDPASWTPTQKLVHLQQKVIGACRRCPLCETRRNIVFGEGTARARIMIVGEAPGAEEDKTGRPFVGAAGERLNSWLEAVGLERRGVFIANVLKCHPPDDRDPFGPEVAACSKFLRAQIRAVRPALLVALGRFAASALLGSPVRMNEALGHLHRYRDPRDTAERPVCVLYHPAYVLRQDQGTDTSKFGKSENEKVIEELRRAVAEVFGFNGPG